MDYTKWYKEVLKHYYFVNPIVEWIRHNENITYKVIDSGSANIYLLRMHKPITTNMQGVQNTNEAIQSELEFLLAWSCHSQFPAQIPVPNVHGKLVTTVWIENEEVHCSILEWIDGETMSKNDLESEERVNTLGKEIALLHRFSQSYQLALSFRRPEYGLEWTETMLSKLRSGEEIGIISTKHFHIVENTFSLIKERLKVMSNKNETWGFIHADINYSNLILSAKGISFIDFGLSGFGYYAMDVAMGALLTKKELRDTLLASYTNLIPGKIDIEQLEGFMFLAIAAYYAFLVSNKDQHTWIRDKMPGLIEHFCNPFLNGKTVFYTI
jgi:Ser/Thr protein kinase RdoA (MazF antagonist)